MINYYLLTKPGIVFGNLVTVAAGFFLASKGLFNPLLFLATLLGLALVMASACVCNNLIDRPLDKKMERTRNRPLVTGLIPGNHAIVYAICLGILGFLTLYIYTNVLTVAVAATGFFVYVVLYSMWKGRTIYGTAIGSIAGATPPLVGYCAVSNNFDLGASILFFMMVLWQMPHFFAIAIYHFEDYTTANIPVLPIKRGFFQTKIHMAIYIVGFVIVAALLTLFNYKGLAYLAITMPFAITWLALSLYGFKTRNHRQWGRQMFYVSLIVINATSIAIFV